MTLLSLDLVAPIYLRIYSTDVSLVQGSPYLVSVIGDLGGFISKTVTFTMNLIDPCPTASLSSFNIGLVTVKAQVDTVVYTMPNDFYSSEPTTVCGAWNY